MAPRPLPMTAIQGKFKAKERLYARFCKAGSASYYYVHFSEGERSFQKGIKDEQQ